jgi:hypothetical protein
MLTKGGIHAPNANGSVNGTGPLNGWARVFGVIGIPGAIAFYLIWWLTQSLGRGWTGSSSSSTRSPAP